jgi:uncharacterized protein (TIGR02145 family)
MKTLNLKNRIVSVALMFFIGIPTFYSQWIDPIATTTPNDKNIILHLPNITAINSISLAVSCEFTKEFTESFAVDQKILGIGVIWSTSTNSLTVDSLNVGYYIYDPSKKYIGYNGTNLSYYDLHPGFERLGTNKKYTHIIPASRSKTFVIGDNGAVNADPVNNQTNVKTFRSDVLQPNTTYYISCFVIWSRGDGWASQYNYSYSTPQSFTTSSDPLISNNVLHQPNLDYMCSSTSSVSAITGYSVEPNGGCSYTWQKSSDNSTWQPISEATSVSYSPTWASVSPTVPITQWYRRVVTCGVQTSTSSPVYITFVPNSFSCTPVRDGDDNIYLPVTIGNRVWLWENLYTTKYNDRETPIALVTNSVSWSQLTTPAYCFYDNTLSSINVYGNLYNGFVATQPNVCPIGYRVPKKTDWDDLAKASVSSVIGQDNTASSQYEYANIAAPLIAQGTSFWTSPNTRATNSLNFTALGGGGRDMNGTFVNLKKQARFWSQDGKNSFLYVGSLNANDNDFYLTYKLVNSYGLSIRCVKDK